MKHLSWAALAALLAVPAGAQITPVQTGGVASIEVPCVVQTGGACAPVSAASPLPADTLVRGLAMDRGASVGTTAVTMMPANSARRGWSIQNQSASATCWLNGIATATTDFRSLLIAPGSYTENPVGHVGTGAISVICSAAATPVYMREW